jgi:signal transduction histidine kinase
MRELNRILPPGSAALLVFALVIAAISGVRALGLGSGLLLAATPASALALAAALALRAPGVVAAGLGFAAAGLLWGIPAGAAIADGIAHGLAAALAGEIMRRLARRRVERSKTSDWLIFLAGMLVFCGGVAAVLAAAARLGVPEAPSLGALLVFEPLGLMTGVAVLASLPELARVRSEPAPALAIAALGLFLLAMLALALRLPFGDQGQSGVTLMLAVPLCLWIAMQRRSLDGAVIGFASVLALLTLLRAETGSILVPEFLRTLIYLSLLAATCQLLHAVNLDRLAALGEVETQKQELERRVAERTARLTAANEAVLAADAAKSLFVARVSHEVRTPLNGVLGMAAVVLDGRLDPQVRRNVEMIRTSGLHLLDVINRLLDHSQLDRPLRSEDFVEFDLADLVDEVLEEARCLPYAAGLTLRRADAPGLATWRIGYRHGLRQILTNLVGNAAKFTDRGAVTVRLSALADDGVRIEVADTGIGMAPAVQERVFLAYERVAEASVGRYGGTGLGLAICADIVKRLGGRIGVDSAPGAGSRFWAEIDMPEAASRQKVARLVGAG